MISFQNFKVNLFPKPIAYCTPCGQEIMLMANSPSPHSTPQPYARSALYSRPRSKKLNFASVSLRVRLFTALVCSIFMCSTCHLKLPAPAVNDTMQLIYDIKNQKTIPVNIQLPSAMRNVVSLQFSK